jgi:hypothetical protein
MKDINAADLSFFFRKFCPLFHSGLIIECRFLALLSFTREIVCEIPYKFFNAKLSKGTGMYV